ncbi:DUF2215 domain-containing protein [Cephalotus follicularis]|uniref:DUF2215 domain-containing protein n=1 Tax=Cephalotus follicularis TaxID=3775 RepID=A0A1Q3D866_CEPFO|nr:DUF2215 domain-containing protein [Cephalotus follicularis]
MGFSSPSTTYISLLLSLSLFIFSNATDQTTLKGVDLEHPVVDVIPSPLSGPLSKHGAKEVLLCERVKVSGHLRLKLGSYANSLRVTVAPSVVIPDKLHSKIQICFHRNASLGLCQCEEDEWKAVQKGIWNSVMSPYDERYIDVKFIGQVSGSVTVAIEEEFQQWRLLFLAVGFVLLLLAPVVSNWVPFYYSSSMAIGVFLVIIIILFQGMKLLPTGRKNAFYLTLYGSVLGVGSFLLHQFSMLINSVLLSFGLNEEMHNPVAIFVLVGIVLAGAALGYWIVGKFVLSKDGSVDFNIAQFVKWALRVVATTFVFQSTLDTPLAMGALASCCAICSFITSPKWRSQGHQPYSENGSPWLHRQQQAKANHNRTEFLSRSPQMSFRGNKWNSPKSSPAWSNSPVKGVVSQSAGEDKMNQQNYYSTFHKTANRKRFTQEEWDDFSRDSTRQAVAELTASPEFTDWIIEHAGRIKLVSSDSSDESIGSESTDENAVGSCSRFPLFNW